MADAVFVAYPVISAIEMDQFALTRQGPSANVGRPLNWPLDDRQQDMKPTNRIFTGLSTTIFEEMSRLALAHDAVNLGQGFPDTDGPSELLRHAAEALLRGPNQYPPMLGLPVLRQAVAAAWQRFHGIEIDWQSEVLVTSGATEALSRLHQRTCGAG